MDFKDGFPLTCFVHNSVTDSTILFSGNITYKRGYETGFNTIYRKLLPHSPLRSVFARDS